MTTEPTPATRNLLLASIVAAAALLQGTQSLACGTGRVDVYDRTAGESLPSYRHGSRRYIVGTPGHEYAIRIRNCTGGRLLAVVSVDGVNVVTGETAAPDQAGYVIEPGGYVNIQGWRKDLERTAAFYFSDPSDSYAARTGRPDDLGVIGVALFREKRRSLVSREDAAAEAPTGGQSAAREATAPQVASSLGTGHGRREDSPVERVEFERASDRPDQRVVLRYERRDTLVAMGVLEAYPSPREPNPFPGQLGFVPDP